jgi:hypothetical protein
VAVRAAVRVPVLAAASGVPAAPVPEAARAAAAVEAGQTVVDNSHEGKWMHTRGGFGLPVFL